MFLFQFQFMLIKKAPLNNGASCVCGQYCLRSFIALREHAVTLPRWRLPRRP